MFLRSHFRRLCIGALQGSLFISLPLHHFSIFRHIERRTRFIFGLSASPEQRSTDKEDYALSEKPGLSHSGLSYNGL